jgi:hypothetical protein
MTVDNCGNAAFPKIAMYGQVTGYAWLCRPHLTVVIGSPRRSNALPHSAITIRIAGLHSWLPGAGHR